MIDRQLLLFLVLLQHLKVQQVLVLLEAEFRDLNSALNSIQIRQIFKHKHLMRFSTLKVILIIPPSDLLMVQITNKFSYLRLILLMDLEQIELISNLHMKEHQFIKRLLTHQTRPYLILQQASLQLIIIFIIQVKS